MSQKNKIDKNIKLNLVLIHGLRSKGEAFSRLAERFLKDGCLPKKEVKVTVVKYGVLLLSIGRLPFVRSIVSLYVASRLATCTYKYPNAKTVVIAHSFGAWAFAYAVKKLFGEFRTNCAILVGSVVPRSFNWQPYDMAIHNFVGQKDTVALLSPLWGAGSSGRFGFRMSGKNADANITQYIKDTWDHDDYLKGFKDYMRIIKGVLDNGKKI